MNHQAIYNYFITCPALHSEPSGTESPSYSIRYLPVQEITEYGHKKGVKTYQWGWVLDSVLHIDSDAARAASIKQVFGFYRWINRQRRWGKSPDIAGLQEVITDMRAQPPVRVEDADRPVSTGIYQCLINIKIQA